MGWVGGCVGSPSAAVPPTTRAAPSPSGKLPLWIREFITDQTVNLSTDVAIAKARTFFAEMAQAYPRKDQVGRTLLRAEDLPNQAAPAPPTEPPAPQPMDTSA